MKWSWTVGSPGGIAIRVHATFLILLAWIALEYYRDTASLAAASRGVLFTIAIFVSVILHEFGHALTARRFGVATRDITLLPIGGVAHLERMPDKPRQELAIALAGPAVTLAIILVLYSVLRLQGIPVLATAPVPGDATVSRFVAQLLSVNLVLLVFNLVPAFPMDGGRVLRAVLTFRMSHVRATDLAARVGKVFALFFAVIGLTYNPLLVFIALFVWLGAAAEAAELQVRTALTGVPIESVMVHDVTTLEPHQTLNVALRHVLDGFQQDFPVVVNGQVVGLLTRAGLLQGLARFGRDSLVRTSMERSFRTVGPNEEVAPALAELQEHFTALPVVQDGHLLGLVTLENLREYLMIEAALQPS